MVVEGGGATGLAALLPGAQLDRHGEKYERNLLMHLSLSHSD
jgi:hypothetical protein